MSANDSSSSEYATKIHSTTGEKLYLSDEFADFHFIIKNKSSDGSPERIPVHKNILATASDVFRVMFNGSWKEKVDVEIVDASVGAFKEFLQFFYLSKTKVTVENAAEVMNLGKKYDVTECFNICGQFLEEHLTADDVVVIYELAVHLEHEELKKSCEEYIADNTQAIFKSESYLKSDQKTVKRILQIDSLSCSESEIFESLMEWMKAKVEGQELSQQIVQEQFSDLLHEIRFGSMTMDDFLSFDPLYGALFTLDEHREIVQIIHFDEFQPKIFKAKRRNNFAPIQWNEDAVINCNRRNGVSKPYYIKNIETTTFTVNQSIALGAFSFLDICRYENGYQVPNENPQSQIKILGTPDLANSNRKVVLYDGKNILKAGRFTRIVLPKPILLQPERKYEIQIKIEMPSTENWCTGFELKREVDIKPNITVHFQNDPIIGYAARGLIGELELNEV